MRRRASTPVVHANPGGTRGFQAGLFGGAALLLAACAAGPPAGMQIIGDREVSVVVPTSRMEVPEPAPRRIGVGQGFGSVAEFRLTGDQLDQPPDFAGARNRGYGDGEAVGRLEVQASPALEFAVLARGEAPVGQVKWNALRPDPGAPGASMAVTVAWGTENESYPVRRTCGYVTSCTPATARTELKITLLDGAVILGRPLSRRWLLFGGPFATRMDFDGRYENTQLLIERTLNHHATVFGFNTGLALRMGDWGRLIGELAFAHVEMGDADDQLVHLGVVQYFHFGRRSAAARPRVASAPRGPGKRRPTTPESRER